MLEEGRYRIRLTSCITSQAEPICLSIDPEFSKRRGFRVEKCRFISLTFGTKTVHYGSGKIDNKQSGAYAGCSSRSRYAAAMGDSLESL